MSLLCGFGYNMVILETFSTETAWLSTKKIKPNTTKANKLVS